MERKTNFLATYSIKQFKEFIHSEPGQKLSNDIKHLLDNSNFLPDTLEVISD